MIPGLGESLGWEDPLEKEMATHSSILATEFLNSVDRGAWWATVHGVTKSRKLSNKHFYFHCIEQEPLLSTLK